VVGGGQQLLHARIGDFAHTTDFKAFSAAFTPV
jgi:hypothetical protein